MKVSLSRGYSFSASHRLHNPEFGEEKNLALYGKCNNPYGHGHNYRIEVTLTGQVDAETGMIANLGELDPFVRGQVLEHFDHRYLNEEVPEFKSTIPTTENLCLEIFRRLRTFPRARLERVRVEETGKNSFEYSEEPTANLPE
jgi:6-pyruvoyltetrahydropterin/6-carboxytetrahydropterin synthase